MTAPSKYLKAPVRILFDSARTTFLSLYGNNSANQLAFDSFLTEIENNVSLAGAYNDAFDTKLLLRVSIVTPAELR